MAIETLKVGPGKLSIGDTEDLTQFESQIRSAILEPEVDKGDPLVVLSGEKKSGNRTETWQMSGTMLQDFGATDSKTEWLFEHRGEDLPFEYTPNTAAGKKITGTLTVEAIAIGGEVSENAESDFEFVLVGEPKIEASE